MSKAINVDLLVTIVAEIGEMNKALGPHPDWIKEKNAAEAWLAKQDQAIRALVAKHGGAVKDSWQGSVVRMAGFRATSTSSLSSALSNWRQQAVTKCMAQGGAA